MATGVKNGQIQELDDNEIDYEIPSFARLVGSHPNLVPYMSNTQAPRTFYGSRFLNQSLPVDNPEAPLIQVQNPETLNSFESEYGERMGARYWRSDKEGTVKEITPDFITITDSDGVDHNIDTYNNFEFNRKTQITNRPVVKKGDKIKPNQILAASNYTDDNGTLSMGKNARVALVPFKGYSMDDAVVISESFAKRMTSQHSYEHSIQRDSDTKFDKKHFTSVFPTKFTTKQLDALDANGIVKPGTVLHKGDPIILATRPKQINSNAQHLGKLGKLFKTLRSDASEVWDHDYPGYVTGVADGKKNAKAFITASVPTQVGDKLILSRPGQKGIVSKIIPDEQMLRSLDGTPFEVLLNPLGLPSRVNTATLHELAMSKIAKKNGKPIVVPSFTEPGKSRLTETLDALKEAGISPVEEVFDPMTGRKLQSPVSTGYSYTYKLHHVVASKKSSRGQGAYSQDEQPLKGGSDQAQSKRLGGLEVTAIMAKGGYNNLREASTLRGQKNDDYWRVLRQGYKPAEPGTPFIFGKYLAMLNGAGLHAKDLGKGTLRLKPFTDKDLMDKNPRQIKNGKMIKTDTLEGIADGLFDEHLVANNGWGYIKLDEPTVNPAAESQVMQLLGIKQKDLRSVLAGHMTLKEAQELSRK